MSFPCLSQLSQWPHHIGEVIRPMVNHIFLLVSFGMFWNVLGLFLGLWKLILTCGTKTNKAVKIEGHSSNVVGTLCQFRRKMLIWYYQVHFSPFWAYKLPKWFQYQFLERNYVYRMTFKFCFEINSHCKSLFSAQLNPWVVLEMCQSFKFSNFFTGLPSQDNTGHFGPFQVCKYHGYYSFCGSESPSYRRQSKQNSKRLPGSIATFQIV